MRISLLPTHNLINSWCWFFVLHDYLVLPPAPGVWLGRRGHKRGGINRGCRVVSVAFYIVVAVFARSLKMHEGGTTKDIFPPLGRSPVSGTFVT